MVNTVKNPFKKIENPERAEYKRQVVYADLTNPNQRTQQDEYLELQQKAGFTMYDPIVTQILFDNEYFKDFLIALSSINSLICRKKLSLELAHIRWDGFVLFKKACMPRAIARSYGFERIAAIRIFGHDRIDGTDEGWVGKITTQNSSVRVIRTEDGKR